MNKGKKLDENDVYICSNCEMPFKADKNSMSITDDKKVETYFCSSYCLKQFWNGKGENDKHNKAPIIL